MTWCCITGNAWFPATRPVWHTFFHPHRSTGIHRVARMQPKHFLPRGLSVPTKHDTSPRRWGAEEQHRCLFWGETLEENCFYHHYSFTLTILCQHHVSCLIFFHDWMCCWRFTLQSSWILLRFAISERNGKNKNSNRDLQKSIRLVYRIGLTISLHYVCIIAVKKLSLYPFNYSWWYFPTSKQGFRQAPTISESAP